MQSLQISQETATLRPELTVVTIKIYYSTPARVTKFEHTHAQPAVHSYC